MHANDDNLESADKFCECNEGIQSNSKPSSEEKKQQLDFITLTNYFNKSLDNSLTSLCPF